METTHTDTVLRPDWKILVCILSVCLSIGERLFSCDFLCSDPLSGCECVSVSSEYTVALISLPSRRQLQLPDLITSVLSQSLEQTLKDQAVCLIFPIETPFVSTYTLHTHRDEVEQYGRVNDHKAMLFRFLNISRPAYRWAELDR